MVIKRPELYEVFNRELETKKAIYIYGPTGWGKTTAVLDWLDTQAKAYVYLTVGQVDFEEIIASASVECIVIDDIHNVNALETEQLILSVMNSYEKRHLILIGRGAIPAYLKPYQMTRQLAVFDTEVLKMDRGMIAELLSGCDLTDPALSAQIESATKGYPMAIFFMVKLLADGAPMNMETFERMKQDLFDCFDALIYRQWDAGIQKFMLHMATFDVFTEKMAELVTGKKHVIEVIEAALSSGSYLSFQPPYSYSIHPVFRNFLLQKQHSVCSEKFMDSTYHNAALYYELEDDFEHALYFYQLCGDMDKLAELLILNSNRHPGNGHYYETERYYRALPEETILESPDLMCGMSMLCSVCLQPEESEYWFSQLKQYGENSDKREQLYKAVQGKLAYLEIALPHRGSKNIAAIFLNVAKAYRAGEFQLQEFSVTSNQPSMLHGGKDFCAWVRHDRKLYYLMKKPLELILGKYGVGLADIALAESLLEKSTSDNLTEIMMLVNSGQNAAACKGYLEVEFAAVGVLCRVMLLQNNLASAYMMLDNVQSRAESAKLPGMVSNIKAQRMIYFLMEGKLEAAQRWCLEDAPDETKAFLTLNRYCYLAKVRCYLSQEKYADAIALLGRVLDYFKSYDRTYDQLMAGILLAVTQYRMEQAGWQKTLNDTLLQCENYGFIRFIAEEGAALLPLLQKAALTVSDNYAGLLIEETRRYALKYPLYLKPGKLLAEPLTDTEKNVLQLICNGLSNQEIAQLMDVTLRTVKFHTGNLYTKMDVKNRAQAIKKAGEML